MTLLFIIFCSLIGGGLCDYAGEISGEYYEYPGPLNMEVSCAVGSTSNDMKITATVFERTSTDKFEFSATGRSDSCLLTAANIFNLTFFDNRDNKNHTWAVFPRIPISLAIKPDDETQSWYVFYKLR
jgi:hypothetical protein